MLNYVVPSAKHTEPVIEELSDDEISRPSTPVFENDDKDFFGCVVVDGFPDHETAAKVQPWRSIVKNGLEPPKDGTLMIACPKKCDWGSGAGLGGY